jgi:hypothetical protein
MSEDPGRSLTRPVAGISSAEVSTERKIASLVAVAPDSRPEGTLHPHDLWGVAPI